MPISGAFRPVPDAPPAPYVTAQVHLPNLGVASSVSFLIDTGSDITFLHSDAVHDLGIDYRQLNPDTQDEAWGVGGTNAYYREKAELTFTDTAGQELRCELDIFIIQFPDNPTMQDAPSLLGRDFLDRCDLRLNRFQNLALLEPLNIATTTILPLPSNRPPLAG